MRKNIIFETQNKNQYIYLEGLKTTLLLPVELRDQIAIGDKFEERQASDEQKYYHKKYLFLQQYGAFESSYIRFLTKPDPESIKMKLANLRQIIFEITDGCNLKCKYCAYGELYDNYDSRHNRKMSFPMAQQMIDYLFALWVSPYNHSFNNTIDISFYGGEPLLNFPLIKKIINYVETNKKKGFKFSYRMTTNAVLLNKYMDYLVRKKFNLLISIDGDEYNNSHRVTKRGLSSFQTVYNNAMLLKDTYPQYFQEHVEFNAVLHDKNTYEGIYSFIKGEFDKNPAISELSDNGIRKDKISEFRESQLFGSGTPGICRCGSCEVYFTNNQVANEDANIYYGYTITGSNDTSCFCQLQQPLGANLLVG